MSFDQALRRLEERLTVYTRAGAASIVDSHEALAEAAELWQAAQPTNSESPAPDENQRLARARHVIGWLHFLRSDASAVGSELSKIASAVIWLGPSAHHPGQVPKPLQAVVGAAADADRQAHLAADLLLRYPTTPDPVLLDAGVWLLTASLTKTPRDTPDWAARLSDLGFAHQMRFERGGVVADVELAVEAGERAVAATPQDHSELASRLCNLGFAYQLRFKRGGAMADLERAIEAGERAVAITPHGHPDLAVRLSDLGFAYRLRFERGGFWADLERAVETGERAASIASHNHPDLEAILYTLGLAYLRRFERGGVVADLKRAIEVGERAISAMPHDSPGITIVLSNLGAAYWLRFERGGVVADLERAIEAGERAIAATPHGHPELASMLSNLGATYLRRFERGGVVADLDRAVEFLERAVSDTPDDHLYLPARLSNLGLAYLRRFERIRLVADLERAIETLERADSVVAQDHPNSATCLGNLGIAYQQRFERGGATADLDRSVEALEKAVATSPLDLPALAIRLSDLGLTYRLRFERGGVMADLERAIEAAERAAAATPRGHPNLPTCLGNLGIAYKLRFERGGAVADLDRSVETLAQAVDAVPEDASHRTAGWLSGLGLAFQLRFAHSGARADLERAIEAGERAVAVASRGHPDLASWLGNLISSYWLWLEHREVLRIEHSKIAIDRETLRGLVAQFVALDAADPADLVRAADALGSLANAMNEHDIAVELLDAGVGVLPSVRPREAGWLDQEHRIGRHRGLVAEAVAAHCALNDLVGAVETAELGRGILFSGMLDSQSDLTILEQKHPELAKEFRVIRDGLNATQVTEVPRGKLATSQTGEIEHRRNLWRLHDQLLEQIRQQSGFARFLLPPRFADLQQATEGGAAVLVNTGRQRSDAIIIPDGADPVHVPLPDARNEDVLSHANALLEVTHNGSPAGILKRQRVLPEILGWLWNVVVEPILYALPAVREEIATSSRVWWLPTGQLGLFPLHAAGLPGQPGALDSIISSYTPTLRALAHSRGRPQAMIRRQVTVAMRETPGLSDLPGTFAEAASLHADYPDTDLLVDEEATTSRVLAKLSDATWAHFACHARFDLTSPSGGGLALHDRTLTLPEISQMRLINAELAYLSACSTANRGFRLADESLHVASAFQLAGFRHVIGSLWPLNDHIAAVASTAFYRNMPAEAAADHAAAALNHVTRQLRDRNPDRPDLWSAIIHSGI
ncbi:CHAT domain-containing protein [Saccharopolyspora mangrovi]|uniref:Tetratricopeptide repeat protein n=1 Tax=Saccharopolyspora mangrovi TaxID=3082379 RepID=A0ABU6AGA0_9PSEU|nr:CHAT domain-containing protein [Saccharopolyspora sp. S2-29]MEB3370498.1 tetratricopeptide repeat protein [Saccharopolyspora sp. S2-29]